MKKLLFVVLLLSACSVQLLAQMKTSRISVATDFSRNGDSLTVRVSRYTGRLDEIARNFKAVFKAGKFGLAIPAHEYAQYIQIQFFLSGTKNS
ncbi:hypothetical protein ACRQ5D_34355 [Mucilaginibacter sp. P25]|uniref:hypothetical protein n=1 Tax=Mucilaginibacter sp. P25 TaxID=3423945 RepID=UPI003D7BBB45